MASFDDFWVKLHVELVELSSYSWRGYRDAAISDGKDFLEKTKDDMQRWCTMLKDGKLSQDDFALLLVGKKDRAELAALRRRGLPQAALDRYFNELINAVAATAHNFFS
ncbi:MAG: hypothetical protein ACM3MD_05940 [Betaproteobacteria bacterium]